MGVPPVPCPFLRRYGVAGPEIVREYMQVGLNRSRVEMDPGQLHVKVVREANESAGLERKSAVIAISELVCAGMEGT